MDDKDAKVIIDMLKELQGNMDSFRADMKNDLKEMRTRMIIRFNRIDGKLEQLKIKLLTSVN